MQRPLSKPTTFEDRLAQEAQSLRKQAPKAESHKERERLLRKARQAETAARIQDWLSSPGLQPPT